jgi:hypothetical protein
MDEKGYCLEILEDKWQERAEKRLEMLIENEWVFDFQKKVYICLFCEATSRTREWAGIMDKHDEDCELAREIALSQGSSQ